MQEATDELLENIREPLYYRGIHGLDSRGRIGIYFTKYPEEAKFYDEKIMKAYLNPTRALVSETSVDLAEMLGLIKEYDELIGVGKYIEADDLLSRKGLKLGYDAFVRRDGDWVVVLKPEIIKEVREGGREIMSYPERLREHVRTEMPSDHELLLHFGIEEVGSPGIVLYEATARATPCSCFAYKGKDLCWSKGIIGLLTQDQQAIYCVAGKAYKEQPKLVERYTKFAEAAEEAHKKIEAMPKGRERLEVWLEEMGKELSKRAIEV